MWLEARLSDPGLFRLGNLQLISLLSTLFYQLFLKLDYVPGDGQRWS